MLSQSFYRLYTYIRHSFRSIISSKGYGVHSPFAFELVTDLINNNDVAYYAFDTIEKHRYQCYKDHSKITLKNGKTFAISKLCRRSSSPDKDAQILFKLGIKMKSRSIIELGTFMGFGTAYLASISNKGQVISIDHDKTTIALAKKNLDAIGVRNVQLINNSIDSGLPTALNSLKQVDFIFFDGNHTYDATLNYFGMALPHINTNSVFVFHDIHWSKDMYKAWKAIAEHPKVTLSIERYNMGIVFFDSQYQKLHYYA